MPVRLRYIQASLEADDNMATKDITIRGLHNIKVVLPSDDEGASHVLAVDAVEIVGCCIYVHTAWQS